MAVTFISHGYDTTVGNPYTESAWAEAFPSIGLARYGVRSATDWKVTAVAGQDRTVSIAAGSGYGHGITDKTFENETIQLDTIISGSRWDLIAVRRDWTPTGGESKFVKVNGGATSVIPGGRLVGSGNIDDQPIALVQVTAGQTQPTALIDLRTWSGDGGGIIAAHDLVRSYLNTVGTRLWIDGVDWIRKAGANDTPEWVADYGSEVVSAAFLQPQPNFTFAGTCYVTQVSQTLRRVDIDLAIIRGAGSFGLTGATIPQPLGTVIPVAARGTSNTKAVATYLNGGGVGTIPLQVNVVPSTGTIDVRSQGAQSWAPNAAATVNVTYYI